ncbi:hypothetical protein ACFC0S_15915 [Streptomyces sp. NPDC056084]|uniref:hypothetical protein n=1 Tax=unclassified Streptomyces TaxID=2593676 RepID=UPI0035DAFE0A
MTITTTPLAPLSAATRGFTTHHGVAVIEIGEDGERLLALGHPDDRRVLAALSAYHRSIGNRLLPGGQLHGLLAKDIERTWGRAEECSTEEYPWIVQDATPEQPGAQPVTWIDHEWLEREEAAVLEPCPRCDRASRSTNWGWGPGRRTAAPHHTCRACSYRWPAAPLYRAVLRKRPVRRVDPTACFACQCSTTTWCAEPHRDTGCISMPTHPIIGRPLCKGCRTSLPADTWQQLVNAGYGSPAAGYDMAERRDLWLVRRAHDGIAPDQAAREWARRLTLVARRSG